jgi:hypothetical protein
MTEVEVGRNRQGAGQPHLWVVWALLCAQSWFDCISNYTTFPTEFLFRN